MATDLIHPKVAQAIEELDAAIMNGDSFEDRDARAAMFEHVDRWRRALTEGQPAIYPCGCSKHKVNLGKCDHYKPAELPEPGGLLQPNCEPEYSRASDEQSAGRASGNSPSVAKGNTELFPHASPGLDPRQCCARDLDRDGNCDRHPPGARALKHWPEPAPDALPPEAAAALGGDGGEGSLIPPGSLTGRAQRFKVNGDECITTEPLTYETIVQLADLTGTPSVKWSARRPGVITGGILQPGDKINGVDGYNFTVVHTGNA